MLKKIISVFIGLSFLCILPVHADKEYKFTLDKDLNNKQIVYQWNNSIDEFTFEMVSPSNEVYSITNSDAVSYDSSNNKVVVSLENFEKGQWKVFFKGSEDPSGLSNKVLSYVPTPTPTPVEEVPVIEEPSSQEIIVIGADNNKPEEISKEETTPEVEVIGAENTETENTEDVESEDTLLSEEELLYRQQILDTRANERTLAAAQKKVDKEAEEALQAELALENERSESEVSLNFEESSETEETTETSTEETKEQVIILGTNADETPTTVELSKGETTDVSINNINADEERAKAQEKLAQENKQKTMNMVIMVSPLIIIIVLFIVNLVLKKKKK